jgi:hypothetical protein
MRGRYVPRHTTRIRGGRSFDVNATMAVVSESPDASLALLTKISLSAPSSRSHVRLPAGTGSIRDVRLKHGGGGWSPLALVASLAGVATPASGGWRVLI